MTDKHYSVLDGVEYPDDIRKLGLNELKILCEEIRDYMIECCSTNPGHLGSSLGSVELIVGLHYVYNTPKDNIVFDVSHQAYAHKIITGRKELFKRNRCSDGISGFTKRDESQYDVFGAGHSSTSISAALGLAKAAELSGKGVKTVAVIGDGALSGGLAFEGLNNASESDILVIINDNNISIDKNTGSLHKHLLWLTTHPSYNSLKRKVWNSMGEGRLRDRLQKFVVSAKSMLVQRSGGDLFEAMGYRYFGPIDGNDLAQVVDALQRLKNLRGSKVLHTITRKGKGYTPAEEDQTTWHAPGMFDPKTGKRLSAPQKNSRYQDVFGEVLLELAHSNDKIVGITPAMATGCGMNLLANEMPERFFDVGIAEEHAVTFSAGLAAAGMKPFCNIYSAFSQRAYDQIIHDVALQNLGVVLCFDRGGLVGEDGATHHGIFDMAAYRSIPNAIVAVPRNETELKNMMYSASLVDFGPYIIRYPRGYGEGADWRNAEYESLPLGKAEEMLSGEKIAIIAAGPVANRAYEAALLFRDKAFSDNGKSSEDGDVVADKVTFTNPAVYNIRYIKPIDTDLLAHIVENFSTVVTIEDGCVLGGLHGAVAEYIAATGKPIKVRGIGIPDRFIGQGTQTELRSDCGLDTLQILTVLEEEK